MNMIELIARFHPLLVHLPIGILVLSLIMMATTRFQKREKLNMILPFALFCAAMSAIASCITGYLLSLNGEYNEDILRNHQWSGIGLAIVTSLAWAAENFVQQKPKWVNMLTGVSLLGLLFIAGYNGGSLTHGSGFLTEGIFKEKKIAQNILTPLDTFSHNIAQKPIVPTVLEKKQDSESKALPKTVLPIVTLKPIESQNKTRVDGIPVAAVDVKPIYVYKDLIQPVLEKRCYSCHGANKSKGGLRLDSPEFILKGGDDGLAMVSGDPDKSYMYGSLILPIDDDYHMPPEGKPQLTQDQIQLIHWWILNGGSFDKTAREMAGVSILPPFIQLPKLDTAKTNQTK